VRVVIFCNGKLCISLKNLHQIISEAKLLIAVDGGANHFKKLKLKPHVIIGDMDSISEQSFMEDEQVEKITYDADKNQTDTELAVLEAFKRGYSQIILLGATGKRLDHTLANIELLKRYPGQIILLDKETKLIAINRKQKLMLLGKKESVVSIFSAGICSPMIKTYGLKYSLDNQKLLFPTQGISNVIQKTYAQIHVRNGLLLVCAAIETKLEIREV